MKRKSLMKVLAAMLICTLLASQMMMVSFAAADPTENTVIQYLTSGWDGDNRAGGIVNDFSTIDENDTIHGSVNWFYYSKESTMAAAKIWEEEVVNTSKDKMVSFDLYIYDNTIPYEVRFYDGMSKPNNKLGEILGEININFLSNQSGKPITTVNQNAKISVNANTTEVMSLTNKQWHKVDVIFSEGKCSYYINGTLIGSKEHGNADSYFTGYQIVSRQGNQASDVIKEAGIYIDNFRSVVCGKDAQFYGKASVSGSNVVVDFSETIASTYTLGFAGVTVNNTKTGAAVAIGTPVISGTTLTIPLNETLAPGTEYVVCFPNKPVGISGKKLYADVYFSIASVNSAKTSSENFDSYNAPSGNTTDIIAADKNWIRDKYINVRDLSVDKEATAADKAHKTVVFANTKSADTIYRWGIKTEQVIDTTKGEASVEFDVKIPDHYYDYLVVQPYSTATGKEDKDLANAGFLSNGEMTSLKNHFGSFTIMGKTSSNNDYTKSNNGNPYVVFDTDEYKIHANKNFDITTTDSSLKVASLAKDSWHTIKMTVDNTTEESYAVVKLYVDGTHVATNTAAIGGKDTTNILKGVRFALKPCAENPASEKIWIDNVKFTYYQDEETYVEKVRIYDLNGNDYGPMATDVPTSAETAKITLSKAIESIEGVTVSLSDGTNTIGSQVTLSSDKKVITAVFDELLTDTTPYTLTVSGTGFNQGTAKFTTANTDELVVHNLRITDAEGNALVGKPTATGTYYVKARVINTKDTPDAALLLGAVYNGDYMRDVNFLEVPVEANKKTEEVYFVITVTSLEDIELSAMAWEGFDTCIPILDAIRY